MPRNQTSFTVFPIFVIFIFASLFNCERDDHKASDHPCHFPDADTENNLREPFTFKIIDALDFHNLVGIDKASLIHPDSVRLFDDKGNEIDPQPRLRSSDQEWIFENLPPYKDVPFNDPQALLNLNLRIFYLKPTYNDTDTLVIHFNKCLVLSIDYNGLNSSQPEGVPTSAGFYFRKKIKK